MNQSKQKLMYLYELFWRETDEEHVLTVPQIIEKMRSQGFHAERRSVYDDIEALRDFGLDIMVLRTRTHGYYLASRTFELAELKLLVDAVQSSKFITLKKSRSLIQKISALASRHEAQQLNRQVFVVNRVKAANESIYYNVDKLHRAISSQCQISFQYAEYTIDKRLQFRRGGERYTVSPYILSWDDENYYLVAYHPRYEKLAHFRVDKMSDIQLTDTPVRPLTDKLDPAEYAKRTFGMFSGTMTEVLVRFHVSLLGVVIDRFGREVPIVSRGKDWFTVRLGVALSPAFLSWVFQFGEKAEIVEPQSVREEMSRLANQVLSRYGSVQ